MNYVTIGKFFNFAQADMVAGRLEAAGFSVLRHSLNSALVEGIPAVVGGVRLQVPEDQAESARTLLQDLELAEGSEAPAE